MINTSMINYLYKITNLVNNKIYIGVHRTDNIDDGYMGSGKIIRYAVRKYGIENFKKEILEYFDTHEEAFVRERIIVNEEFLNRKDVYNIKPGGKGGFNIEDARQGSKLGGEAYKDKVKSLDGLELEEYKKRMLNQSQKGVRVFKEKYKEYGGIWWQSSFKDKKHTDETKKKMSGPRPQSCGEKSSQYGTMWITDGIINKKVKKDIDILPGWKKGRI
jgi:hypothetical protein